MALVVGPRQAGKSTLVWKTLLDAGRPVLLLNAEEPAIAQWLHSPALFLDDLGALHQPTPDLFFEEVQRLPEAGLFLKGLVDRKPGVDIYATGSSSFDLESKTRESLAGRAHRTLLLPLALSEACPSGGTPTLLEHRRAEVSRQMLLTGGFPAVVTGERPEAVLAGLVEAFVVRDASDRFRIRHVEAFQKILSLAASQIGNLCNFSEWAALCGVSHGTVTEYVRLMQECYVLRLLLPFVGGRRAEVTSARKVFFVDNGVRNQIFGGFGPQEQRADRGALFENMVFTEICKSTRPLLDTVRYWRSKSGAEVDFVVEQGGGLIAIEAKAGDARGRIARSARSFIQAYQPSCFAVVSAARSEPQQIGTTEVRFVALADLPGLLRDFRP